LNKNTCWFFGDSFTDGDGCKPDEPYYKKYPNGKLWTTIVSDNLNMNEKNISRGGCSNQFILSNIVCNLPMMNEGDVVVVSNTIPARTMWFDNKEQRHSIVEETLSDEENVDSVILNYITKQLLPNQKEWGRFYIKQFLSLMDELELRNIKTVFWPYTLWYPPNNPFQTIWEHTDGEIQNGHWSWNGHENMSIHIMELLDE